MITSIQTIDITASKRHSKTGASSIHTPSVLKYLQRSGVISLKDKKTGKIITGTYIKLSVMLGLKREILWNLINNGVQHESLKKYTRLSEA